MDRGTRARASCTYAQPFHDSTRVCTCAWPRRACTATYKSTYILAAYVCVCVRVCVCGRDTQLCRARWSTETQHLRGVHETVAPGILSRSRRPACGPPPSPSPDTLSFALTPYPSSPLHPSHPSPSLLLLHPRTPSSYYHLLRATSTTGASHHRRRSSPRPLSIPSALSLSLVVSCLSLSLCVCTCVQRGRSFSPPRWIYARDARTDLSNPRGARNVRYVRDCVEGNRCARAHSCERYSVSVGIARCLSRERHYTIVHLPRMLDIRGGGGGGPLAYIFTIGFIASLGKRPRCVFSPFAREERYRDRRELV